MKYNTHFATISDLIEEAKKACDAYRGRRLAEDDFKALVHTWANNCSDLMFSGPGKYNPTFALRVGKKRLKLLDAMLEGYQVKIDM